MINKLIDIFIYILDWVYTVGTVQEYWLKYIDN